LRSGTKACPGAGRGRGPGRAKGAHRLCLVAARPYPARAARCRLSVGWIIGAVCPVRDTGVALVLTRLDTSAMNLFLAELSQGVAPGAHGVVLMDKAGWHTAGDLVVPENLSLVFLPPYSPELNPIERLWLHLRDNRLTHRVFRTTDEIIAGCCDAWNWLLGETGRIRSLCSYPWFTRVST
jgi:transposase